MALIDPNNIIKTSNASMHDLTYDDVYCALSLVWEDNLDKGDPWTKLYEKVLEEGNMESWRGNDIKIKVAIVKQHKW